MRFAINYHWPKKISDNDLYNLTNVEPWSKTIQRRRLNWLGHLLRLNENTPARRALDEALTPARRPVGGQITRWLDTIKTDLLKANITINLKDKQESLNTLIGLTEIV